jgi:hypothetical protein
MHRVAGGEMYVSHVEWWHSPWFRITDATDLPIFVLYD